MRKVYNNVIVKNFQEMPIDTPENLIKAQDHIKKIFEKYGQISSICVK